MPIPQQAPQQQPVYAQQGVDQYLANFGKMLSDQSQHTQSQLALQTESIKTVVEDANSKDWTDFAFEAGSGVFTAGLVVAGILIFTGE